MAIVGSIDDSHSKPSFIFTDTIDLGSVYVIETYESIPIKSRPQEPLPSKLLADTSWAKATMPVGMALIPTVMLKFFGQHLFEGSIHDADFDDRMEAILPIHLKWAKLFKEHVAQQENDGNDATTIFDRLNKKLKRANNAIYCTAGFVNAYIPDSCFFFTYTLLNQDKWPKAQEKLREFFVGNPSPTKSSHLPLDPLQSPSDQKSSSCVNVSPTKNDPPCAPTVGVGSHQTQISSSKVNVFPTNAPPAATRKGATAPHNFDPMVFFSN